MPKVGTSNLSWAEAVFRLHVFSGLVRKPRRTSSIHDLRRIPQADRFLPVDRTVRVAGLADFLIEQAGDFALVSPTFRLAQWAKNARKYFSSDGLKAALGGDFRLFRAQQSINIRPPRAVPRRWITQAFPDTPCNRSLGNEEMLPSVFQDWEILQCFHVDKEDI